MERIIVDSDILILVSRNIPTAVLYLENLEKTRGVALSAVSAFELLSGSLNKADQAAITKLLSRFEHIHMTRNTKDFRFIDGLRLVEYP